MQRYAKTRKQTKKSRFWVQNSFFLPKIWVQNSFFLGTKLVFPSAFYSGVWPFLPYARARQAFTSFTCKQASGAPRWGLSGKVVNLGGWDGAGKTALERSGGPFSLKGKQAKRGRDARPPEARTPFARAWRGVHKHSLCKFRKSASYGNKTHSPGGSREAPASLPAGGEGGQRPSFQGSGGLAPECVGSWVVGVFRVYSSFPGEGKRISEMGRVSLGLCFLGFLGFIPQVRAYHVPESLLLELLHGIR